MTPEETLDRAMEMLVSEDYAPIVMQALKNSKDIAVGAAMLVAPIIIDLRMRGELPDEELLGSEEGDGIAIHLLSEVFGIAADGGLANVEDPAEQRALAERAVELLGDLLAKSAQGQPQGAPQPQTEPQPPQPQGLLAGVA